MKRIFCTLLLSVLVLLTQAQVGVFQKVISDSVFSKDFRFRSLPNYSLFNGVTNIISPTTGTYDLTTPPGTTAQRPTVPTGKYILRYNTDSAALEIGNPSQVWKTLSMSSVQSFDTTAISNFGLKVRSLISATAPLQYNAVTGNLSIPQATSSTAGYLASADWVTFNAKLPDPGSNGLVARTASGITAARQLIPASSNVSIVNANGVSGNPSIDINDTLLLTQLKLPYIPAAASTADSTVVLNRSTNLLEIRPVASSGAILNNVGLGYRLVKTSTGNIATVFGGYGILIDSTSNSNGLTWKADTISSNGLATLYDLTQTANISNTSLTANGTYAHNWNNKQWYLDSIAGQFLFRMGGVGNTGTRRKEFRINWSGPSFGDNLDGYNMFAVVKKADNITDSLRLGLISSGLGTLSMGAYDVATSANNTFISYSHLLGLINISAKDSIWIKGAVPAATADSILGVQFVSGTGIGKIVKIPISAAGSSVTLNNIGSGYRWLAAPSGNYKTVFASNTILWDSTSNANALTPKVDTSVIATQNDLGYYAPLTSVDSSRKYVPLVVFAGESNPVGVVSNAGLSGSELSPFPRIQILNNQNYQLEALHIGVNNNINVNSSLAFHGMELQLMKSITADSAFLHDTVYLVKIARSAASMSMLVDTLPVAYARLDTAIAQIRAKGYYPQIYMWMSQGINDAVADSATWLKNRLYYVTQIRKHINSYFPVFETRLIGAGVTRNNTIDLLPYWDGFTYVLNTTGFSTMDANHWDSAGIASICKRMLSFSADSVMQRDLYVQTQANHIKRGYFEATMVRVDSDVDFNGNATIAGNVNLDGDNKGLTLAGGSFGILKATGNPGWIGIASGQSLKFRRSNQASNISATDTYTDIFEINSSNNTTLFGDLTIGGSFTSNVDNTTINPGGGHIGFVKQAGGPAFMGVASGQPFTLKRSNEGSNISASGTYTEIAQFLSTNQFKLSSYGVGTHTGTPAYSIQTTSGGAIIEGPLVAAGTYTPTLTNETNIASSTASQCQYMRVGNTVTVSGKFNVDYTSTGASSIGISLPIASNIANDYEVAGTANPDVNPGGLIRGDATNDRAQFVISTVSSAAYDYYFVFTYTIL